MCAILTLCMECTEHYLAFINLKLRCLRCSERDYLTTWQQDVSHERALYLNQTRRLFCITNLSVISNQCKVCTMQFLTVACFMNQEVYFV